jgi:hypothetical protein
VRAPIVLATVALVAALACSGTPGKDTAPGPQEVGPPASERATSAEASPTSVVTAFGDGTYEIGNAAGQVPPGKYRATVPPSEHCYWERLKGLSGQFDDIIANANEDAGAPLIVTIATTDKAFKTSGCGIWRKT